ncbi:3-phosphoserine/phosphohydroxythreonine transaminase [Marinobacterium arenosum]|uniref:3-phosphoserine/phosphohydroxythreonine transaminase n=1 Tax=Marinobacterium arenosum TaxID=2862496 RepID=UPI001C9551D5|nr:3-phosphoserine/phosphohydroxythreonine transaminase [Marinobacterium arenosum]MBY4676013.1 3-phosphoserine/phosphohydroxythreonine transaminase [Marinobacterium arenosum]
MTRKYNFSAGPAGLPDEVLLQAQQELLDWQGKGLSIMEMSHRSDEFVAVAEQAEQDLRELMAVPDNYRVLFLQGGATGQFAMIPLNLLGENGKADYINTGVWSSKAIKEARLYGDIHVAGSTEADNFSSVPAQAELALRSDAAYLHYTPNETIGGVAYDYIPDSGEVPLVADYSSSILSEPLDVSRFGLIYAGAQKNIGPAGLTVVIIREDLLGNARPGTPTMLDYQPHAKAGSMLNTPPTFGWYLAGLVFQWLKRQGGVTAMAECNRRKAGKLYDFVDRSAFYANPVAVANRSLMNVPFTLADDKLDALFLQQSEAAGLLNLQGHRSVGGMRASLYNAVPEAAVDALIDFMAEFERTQG